MATIDLRQFVSKRGGPWSQSEDANTFSPSLFRLSRPEDFVTLNGPVSVKVSLQVRNQFMLGGSPGDEQTQPITSYRVDVPPGQSWTYNYPTKNDSPIFSVGSNARFEVTVESLVGGIDYYDKMGVDPYHSRGPCGCHTKPCSCPTSAHDLPCDFAVGSHTNLGEFFPSACEPCAPGSFVRMPPLAGPRLSIPPASGGCTRTNYFNGMFITKEDLLTDQRNMRIKQQLQNRAMGQGVVWGLGVGLHGGSVVVQPGYAVDCCGNDIAITSPYQVDSQALTQDPAAAAELSRGGPRRMHLLLEYFECPEDPRLVHGDACSSEVTHCEMGRIRETARLRLVPPRDLDSSGPIDDFLKSLPKPAPEEVGTRPGGSDLGNAGIGTNTPFTIEVSVRSGLSPREEPNFQVQPAFGEDRKSKSETLNFVGIQQEPETNFFVHLPLADVTSNRFATLADIQIFKTSKGGRNARVLPVPLPAPSPAISFAVVLDSRTLINSTDDGGDGFVAITVNSWSVAGRDGSIIADGNTTLTIAWKVRVVGKQLDVEIATTSEGRAIRNRFPCLTEACDPEGGRLFPVTPPWMHDFPHGSGRAVDLQVLQAAFNFIRRLASGPTEVTTAPVGQTLVTQIATLFDAWCRESLYRGPKCYGEPHGVIIGCAVVNSGRILSVDPWGGRRWVLHFPLLTHWSGLAGVAPLDYLASKAFEFICCIASHVRSTIKRPVVQDLGAAVRPSASDILSSHFSMGTSQLVFDSKERLSQHFSTTNITFKSLPFGEFLQQALRVALQPTSRPITDSAVAYVMQGFDGIFLVAPPEEDTRTIPVASVPEVQAQAHSEPDEVRRLVRNHIDARNEADPIPRLLRRLAEDLTIKFLQNIPLTTPSERDTATLNLLSAGGVTSISDLLSADPEHLLQSHLNGKSAQSLANVLDHGDRMADKVLNAVASAITQQSKKGLACREDLQSKTLIKQFANAQTASLNNTLEAKQFSEKTVRQWIEELVPAGKPQD